MLICYAFNSIYDDNILWLSKCHRVATFEHTLQQEISILFLWCLASFVAFLFEKINKTKVVFCGETVPAKERVLLIANHRTEVDWMYLWDFALPKGCHGYIKYILKSSLMKILYLVGDFTFWSSFQWRESGRLMNQTCTKCFQLLKIPKTPSGLLFSLKAPISRNFFFQSFRSLDTLYSSINFDIHLDYVLVLIFF